MSQDRPSKRINDSRNGIVACPVKRRNNHEQPQFYSASPNSLNRDTAPSQPQKCSRGLTRATQGTVNAQLCDNVVRCMAVCIEVKRDVCDVVVVSAIGDGRYVRAAGETMTDLVNTAPG
jgi:hypothetical protein